MCVIDKVFLIFTVLRTENCVNEHFTAFDCSIFKSFIVSLDSQVAKLMTINCVLFAVRSVIRYTLRILLVKPFFMAIQKPQRVPNRTHCTRKAFVLDAGEWQCIRCPVRAIR